jgi:phosphomannomutase
VAAIDRIYARFKGEATHEDRTDGLSLSFADRWRFNIRMSNTEPVLRLNVETNGDEALMLEKRDQILEIIKIN